MRCSPSAAQQAQPPAGGEAHVGKLEAHVRDRDGPRIQRESAFATGLSPRQTFARVVLPEPLRNMLPALIATFVMMFKVTSLVYVVGIIDFFRSVIIVNNRDFAPYALYTTLAIVYFVCCYTLSWLVRKLDPKYALTS